MLAPLERLALAYAKPGDARAYALMFSLDRRLADVLRSTSEPLLGQMRYRWWRDTLAKPAKDRPSGEPLLEALAAEEGEGDRLATAALAMVDGWEMLLAEEQWDVMLLKRHAATRGGALFSALATHCGLTDEKRLSSAARCGRSWALANLARNIADPELAATIRDLGQDECEKGVFARDPRLRPLSVLALGSRLDVMRPGGFAGLFRFVRLSWHGLTGR